MLITKDDIIDELLRDIDNALAKAKEAEEKLRGLLEKERTGHWIHTRCDMYECSECGHTYTSFDPYGCDANYCPNCGKHMIEEKANE